MQKSCFLPYLVAWKYVRGSRCLYQIVNCSSFIIIMSRGLQCCPVFRVFLNCRDDYFVHRWQFSIISIPEELLRRVGNSPFLSFDHNYHEFPFHAQGHCNYSVQILQHLQYKFHLFQQSHHKPLLMLLTSVSSAGFLEILTLPLVIILSFPKHWSILIISDVMIKLYVNFEYRWHAVFYSYIYCLTIQIHNKNNFKYIHNFNDQWTSFALPICLPNSRSSSAEIFHPPKFRILILEFSQTVKFRVYHFYRNLLLRSHFFPEYGNRNFD